MGCVDRPVIVAENMIGCAMYELVGTKGLFLRIFHAEHGVRSELVMIRWSERSFGLKRTRLRFRFTKKQVSKTTENIGKQSLTIDYSWCNCWGSSFANREASLCGAWSWVDGNHLRWDPASPENHQ